ALSGRLGRGTKKTGFILWAASAAHFFFRLTPAYALAAMHLHRDVIAGTLFILIGAFALTVGRAYPVGSAMRMGPGYFPAVLGWVLIVLGACVGLRAMRRRDW